MFAIHIPPFRITMAPPRKGRLMPEWTGKNLLCYGDNLGFLTDTSLFPDACVDLIYLDPPFNSQQNYNVLFKETSGTPEAAQIKAFEDTWTWDMAANEALTRLHQDPSVPANLVDLTKTFMSFLKASPMMAYLDFRRPGNVNSPFATRCNAGASCRHPKPTVFPGPWPSNRTSN